MIKIAGAGLAGLLAANMLRRQEPVVFEVQDKLPNNHHAVLRFRSSVVGDTLGIPFRKVTMIKGVVPHTNPVADALAYSHKVLGMYKSDRSILTGVVSAERYIAPPDLIARMAEGLDIRYGIPLCFDNSIQPIVSTVPMPRLAKVLSYSIGEDFRYAPGWNIKATVHDCDAFVTLYFPDPSLAFYRASVTGNELIIEGTGDPVTPIDKEIDRIVHVAASALSLIRRDITNVRCHHAAYQKILPLNDERRKRFIHFATERYGIYSLGRFATWRPHLLLDDLVQDVRLIERWLGSDSKYEVVKHGNRVGLVK